MATSPHNEKQKRKFFDKLEPINFEDTATYHNRLIIVEERTFYVLKEVLSLSSDYFRSLFNLAAKPNQVKLKDVLAKSFEFFLNMIYPEHLRNPEFSLSNLTDTSIMLELVSLSFRFQCPVVFNETRKAIHLEYSNDRLRRFDFIAFVNLAIQHDINDFQYMIVDALRNRTFVGNVEKTQILNAPENVKDFMFKVLLDEKFPPSLETFLKQCQNRSQLPTIKPADPINFNDPSANHDRVIIIDHKKFYVLSGVLAISSEHFRAMFNFSLPKENQKPVVLEDLTARSFDLLLKIVYPSYLSEPAHVLLAECVGDSVLPELITLSFRFICPAVYQAVKSFINIEFEKNQLKRFDLVAFIDLVIMRDLVDIKEMVIKTLGDEVFSTAIMNDIMKAPDHVKNFVIQAYMEGKIQSTRSSNFSDLGLTTVTVSKGSNLPRKIARASRSRKEL